MTIRIGQPLPECAGCHRPTKRATFDRTHGLCSDCAGELEQTARITPLHVVTDDTVYVERYLPPVPGQLALEDEQ